MGRQLAMHVAAANPLYLDQSSVPAAALDRERAVLREQAAGSGKSEEIVARMVEGRLRKFYEEAVLLDQVFVIDGETRVSKVVEAAAKQAGAPIRIAGFVRLALGEGVEKPPSDFAAEVGATLKSLTRDASLPRCGGGSSPRGQKRVRCLNRETLTAKSLRPGSDTSAGCGLSI